MTTAQKKRLFELFTAHAADRLSVEQNAELQHLLRTFPEARKLWFLHQDTEIALQRLAKIEPQQPETPFRASETAAPRTGNFILWKAAAVLLFSGLLIFGFNRSQTPVLAQILEVQNARWASGVLPTEAGSKLAAGKLNLVEGFAKLHFSSGVDVVLEGPAAIELVGPKLCRLHHGSLIAKVGKSARGFSVITSSATLVDLGTEFSVSMNEAGHGNVRVMKGEVAVRHFNGAPEVHMHTGEMVFLSPEQISPLLPLDPEPKGWQVNDAVSPFKTELTTRAGQGAATYVSEPRTLDHQSENLLLLKHCRENGYGRKVLLRFDLNELPDVGAMTQARLTVHFGSTGYGYSSSGGDAHIAVFALTQDQADLWNPAELNWLNQPAFDPSAGRVDERLATRVGEFTVPSGVKTGTFTVDDPRLLARIKTDANRLLTLILVRENEIETVGGLVLGIAGNNHPTLAPPTLQLR